MGVRAWGTEGKVSRGMAAAALVCVAMSSREAPIKAVIFDCDGVLVDSEAIAHAVLVGLANDAGGDFAVADVTEVFTGQSMTFVRAYFEERLGSALPDSFEEQYRRETGVRFRENLQPVPGVRSLLEGLNLPRCVASNGPMAKMRANLVSTDLLRYFITEDAGGSREWLFSAYDIEKWKPDPALFFAAAEALGVAPTDCLVVEDSVPGVRAALAGGFPVVAYVGGHESRAGVFEGMGVRVVGEMGAVAASAGRLARG